MEQRPLSKEGSDPVDSAAIHWEERHPEDDVLDHPAPVAPHEPDGIVPNHHSASAEAAALHWHETHRRVRSGPSAAAVWEPLWPTTWRRERHELGRSGPGQARSGSLNQGTYVSELKLGRPIVLSQWSTVMFSWVNSPDQIRIPIQTRTNPPTPITIG